MQLSSRWHQPAWAFWFEVRQTPSAGRAQAALPLQAVLDFTLRKAGVSSHRLEQGTASLDALQS